LGIKSIAVLNTDTNALAELKQFCHKIHPLQEDEWIDFSASGSLFQLKEKPYSPNRVKQNATFIL